MSRSSSRANASVPGHLPQNLAHWERSSDQYERRCSATLSRDPMSWGEWRVPEERLHVLGPVRGRSVLELGCGAARWSVALAARGARVVGVDFSARHLEHARRVVRRARRRPALVRGDAERLPFASAAFDIAFCDWGAMSFADPYRTVPEAARVLRPGGILAFCTTTPIREIARDPTTHRPRRALARPYFGLHRVDFPTEVNFTLPYGEWIRLFRSNRFSVERLIEMPSPVGRHSRYLTRDEERWGRSWPIEQVWVVRRSS